MHHIQHHCVGSKRFVIATEDNAVASVAVTLRAGDVVGDASRHFRDGIGFVLDAEVVPGLGG